MIPPTCSFDYCFNNFKVIRESSHWLGNILEQSDNKMKLQGSMDGASVSVMLPK